MEIKKMEEKNETLKVLVKDTNPAMMNALRRISMKGIPVLAIEDVAIVKNNSLLFDEVIAQRLGQVPLDFDPDKFEMHGECDCEEGCPNCEAVFSLKVEGPGKVYSGDLVCESGEIEPFYDEIPLTELDENQEIEMEATAILSTGEDHSKHQAAISSYQYYPIINVDQDELTKKEKKEVAELCPRGVFEVKDGKLEVTEEARCTLCRECVEAVGPEGITVAGDDEKFIFKVESISALEPDWIIKKTAEILEEKADKVIDKLD
ncbi:MAG: DNA-directed RNA polymerase subunit D [Candidatus Aenigmatarchaeota archaeon]